MLRKLTASWHLAEPRLRFFPNNTHAPGSDFSEVPFFPCARVSRTHLDSWRSGPYPFLSLPQNHPSAFVVGLT